MLGGRVLRGQRSLAEVGHCTLDIHAFYRGEPCTFEQLASGTALVRMAAEAGLPANGAAVMERVNASDPVALALWARLTQAAAIGFTNLCFCYTPQVVVIGGGLGLTGELLYGPIRNHLAAHGPPRLPQPIQIVGAQLGDDAALTGAAGWMRAIGMPT
jgi:glucokinase